MPRFVPTRQFPRTARMLNPGEFDGIKPGKEDLTAALHDFPGSSGVIDVNHWHIVKKAVPEAMQRALDIGAIHLAQAIQKYLRDPSSELLPNEEDTTRWKGHDQPLIGRRAPYPRRGGDPQADRSIENAISIAAINIGADKKFHTSRAVGFFGYPHGDDDELTIAELMTMHEFGIMRPMRPLLALAVEKYGDRIANISIGTFETIIHRRLKHTLDMFAQVETLRDARAAIRAGRIAIRKSAEVKRLLDMSAAEYRRLVAEGAMPAFVFYDKARQRFRDIRLGTFISFKE